MVYMYDNTGEYQGCTLTPEDFPELNHTDIAPPEYDEFDEQVFFTGGVWEIRSV
jgi:hypothetical protein